jgi:hypothetical protein
VDIAQRFIVAAVLAGMVITVGCGSTSTLAIREAESALAKINRTNLADTIRAADLDSLPAPVRRYLTKAGVVGRERIRTFRGAFDGLMKVGGEKAKWTKVHVVQYSFMDSTLTRIFFIKTRIFGIVPVVGRDKYENGKGNMLIRVGDLFTVVNQTGATMDKSELVTFLNDLSFFPMGMLNEKVVWEPVSDTSARAILSDCGISVSGIFFFSTNGDLVNFVTDDRTYDDGRGDVRKARWWTPLRDPREFDGVRISAEGDAVWDFGDWKFHYARFTIKDVGYNRYEFYR